MQIIRCSNKNCGKVIGEIDSGTARFKCKSCGTFTTASIEKNQPAPRVFHQKMDHIQKKAGQRS